MMKKNGILLFLLIVTIDQATKYIILRNFHVDSINPQKKFFRFALHFNHGLSFSLLKDFPQGVLLLIWFFSLFLLLFYCFKKKQNWINLGGILLLSGSVGNLIDRFKYGYVIDWFFIGIYINFADFCLILGGFICLLFWDKENRHL